MKLLITAKEALDKGIWGKLCDIKGINILAVNEGLMDSNDGIVLTEDEARNLGLLLGETKEVMAMTIGEIIADLRARGYEVEAKVTEPTKYRITVTKPVCAFMNADELRAWYRTFMCLDDEIKGD